MAFKYIDSKGNIDIASGDTGSFTVAVNIEGQPYILSEGDTVTLTTKDAVGNAIFPDKEITNFVDGKAIINLSHDDTNQDSITATYKIKLITSSGQYHTLIPLSCNELPPTISICGE